MTIVPLWRNQRSRFSAYMSGPALFALGSVVSAGVLGLLVGAVASILPQPVLLAIPVVGLGGFFILHRVFRVDLSPPTTGWKVPRQWRQKGRPRYSLVFGLLLGLGFVTIVASWSPYVVLAGAAAQGSAVGGSLVFAIFGLARALPMLIVAGRVTLFSGRVNSDPRTEDHGHGGSQFSSFLTRISFKSQLRSAETAAICLVVGAALNLLVHG